MPQSRFYADSLMVIKKLLGRAIVVGASGSLFNSAAAAEDAYPPEAALAADAEPAAAAARS